MESRASVLFVEYCYRVTPKGDLVEERQFFRKMQHMHRSFRDPTYDRLLPENLTDFSQLYIFPYASRVLKNTENQWEMFVPPPIVEDIRKFFCRVLSRGMNKAFLQCQDGEHVEFVLSRTDTKQII
jgi:hypothetical protein